MDEIIRYLVALSAVFLVGTNMAFVINAPEIFPKITCRFWRYFFVGKMIITAVLATDLLTRDGRLTWRAPLSLFGVMISLYALLIIYKDRPYRNITQDD